MVRPASLTLLAACATSPTPPPITTEVCASQHADGDVIVCDRPFDAAPRVHLPADQGDTFYAGFDPIAFGIPHWILRDGSRRDHAYDVQSYEFLEEIYEVSATDVRPVVRLPPEVIDSVLVGTWEGTLSKRTGPNQYDGDTRVPIRVTFTGYQDGQNKIPVWDPAGPQLTYSRAATGTIANATAGQTLASGTCAAALSSLGQASPIVETGPDITMLRMAAMHALGDYQLVINGGMGSILPAHPAAFIQDAARPDFTTLMVYPHGTPNGMHLDEFHAVTGGGQPCP